ncbi:MAG: phosphoribosylaminoimidazolesuccinocarboxamide synthase, partial [Candidatus Marinimicrobia bacterium CG_4_10_14_0_2_um_filter_48_9]
MPIYKSLIQDQLSHCLEKTDLGMGERIQGKVRDSYILPDKMVFVTTDRQSAFDRVLASIPFKGQVLNQTSAWWFDRTRHIIPNHVLSIPDPNVTVGKRCEVFPVEFVMRGYITGSTSTSLWTVYKNGDRNYCGNALPEGLVKNQKLEKNLITPTTKDAVHDRPISPEEIVSEGWMSREDWDYASLKAEELFEYGQ